VTRVIRGDAVPLYHQIYLTLRDDIIAGRRQHGSLMPTEHELVASMAVSRITARRALDELAERGFVERRRRTGTRVIYRAPTAPIEASLERTLEGLLAFGRNTQVRVTTFETVTAAGDLALRLGVDEGERILHVVRTRLLDGEPLGQIESFVPGGLARRITRRALAATPLLALLQASGAVIGGGHQVISARAADPQLAECLGIEFRAPVLRVERTVADPAGRPLLATIAHYRADRYIVSLDLQGGVAAPDGTAPAR